VKRRTGHVGSLVRALRWMRRKDDLTLAEQAERLGVSESMLTQINSGHRRPGAKVLRGVLRAYPHLRDEVRLFLLQGITGGEADDVLW